MKAVDVADRGVEVRYVGDERHNALPYGFVEADTALLIPGADIAR